MVTGRRKRRSEVKLPDWAIPLWEELGCPDIEANSDVLEGSLLNRRHGLRMDDIIEIELDARAYPKDSELKIKGRLMSSGKNMIEIKSDEGDVSYVAKDVIVRMKLVAHMRPPYIDDEELIAYEKEDQKRRTKLHERIEKKTQGANDSHLWG
ncbi:MAG: hypothetical protein CMB48_00225 [Euryarchaeota archaeon]|nr:hypothetical protein [Euryarchaeota archaeon]|tara:strand:+ start:1126 stop:1581 length:456 start_codon:yes stop_codon:yes gene_type:complete